MSLVAYGSSDESDQSDVEDNNRDDKSSASTTDNGALVKRLKQPKHLAQPSPRDKLSNDDQFSDSDTEQGDNVNQNTQDDKLKELPVPKAVDSGGIVENDALEDLVKPKPSQVADIEKPAPKKLRQPVKITIPALPDSDDESDQPAKKKPRPGIGSGKSGLTSILPAPVHAAKKETGRILLPYSLTKKTQSATSGASAVKKNHTTSQSSDTSQKLSASLASYGSDSDDDDETGEPVSFFSLDSSGSNSKLDSIAKSKTDSSADGSKQMIGPSLGPMQMDNTDLNTGIPTVPLPPSSSRTSLNLPAPSRSENSSVDEYVSDPSSSDSAISSLATGTSIDPNAPLTFKGGVSSQRTYGGLYNSNSAMSSSTSSSSGIPSAEGDSNVYYNMPYDGSVHYPESTDVEAFKQDNEFLRLQGRTKRGKEEINLIDVNADDFTDPSEIAKHLSEEQSYQSHRKKDNQPSGQQKRKHQIHYLAFQAKERELELKNQWSQSRQTKKQTQAKYGF